MALPNEQKLVRTSRTSRRLAYDMPRNNALLLDREIITRVARQENKLGALAFFSALMGDPMSADRPNDALRDLIKVEPKGISAEYIRERTYREVYVPGKVTDNSRVPDRLIAGPKGTFVFKANRFMGEKDTTLHLKDDMTNLMVVDIRLLASDEVEYTCQLIGAEGFTASGSLLSMDSLIHYNMGNSKGEGSTSFNSMVEDGEVYSDMFNVMPITRLGFTRTGSYLADDTLSLTVKALDGSEVDYATDLAITPMRKAFYQLDNQLLFDTPNWTAEKRKINNRVDTRYPERPHAAGMYWQWDRAPFRFEHYKRSSDASGQMKLDYIMKFGHERTGKDVEYLGICQKVGRAWLKKMFKGILSTGPYRINLNIDANGKLNGGQVGYDVDTYVTEDGKITIYDITTAVNSWNVGPRSTFDGTSGSYRSNRIYFTPMARPDKSGKMQPIVRILYKEKDNISRLFNLAISKGQVGRDSMTYGQIQNLSDQAAKAMMNNDQYRVDSWVDGDEMGILSQCAPMCQVDDMIILDLK